MALADSQPPIFNGSGDPNRGVKTGPKLSIPTPMSEEDEQDLSYKMALAQPLLKKLGELVGSTVVEELCTGCDKRKRLAVYLSKICPLVIVGDRSRAGHKVPDALRATSSYVSLFLRLEALEVLPHDTFIVAYRKRNVAKCTEILLEFMVPIMQKLEELVNRPDVKSIKWRPASLTIGEKGTERAAKFENVLREWAEFSKTYWRPLEEKLMERLNAVPVGTDVFPYVRKTMAEIERDRWNQRMEGLKKDEVEAKKRKLAMEQSAPPPRAPSKRVNNMDKSYGYNPQPSDPYHPCNGDPYGYRSAPYYTPPGDSRPYFPPPPHFAGYGEPSPSYQHPQRRDFFPPAAAHPSTSYAPSQSAPPPPNRKPVVPAPSMPHQPPTLSENQRRAEQLHQEIQQFVGLFEEKFTRPDGTQLTIMESPFIRKAVNLEYRSIGDAEIILDALKNTWTAVSSTANESQPLKNDNSIVMFNNLPFHRRRPMDVIKPGIDLLWAPAGSEDYRPVTVSRVKNQKAVIDFDNDIECCLLDDLYIPGY